jgi:hypothetical protein
MLVKPAGTLPARGGVPRPPHKETAMLRIFIHYLFATAALTIYGGQV